MAAATTMRDVVPNSNLSGEYIPEEAVLCVVVTNAVKMQDSVGRSVGFRCTISLSRRLTTVVLRIPTTCSCRRRATVVGNGIDGPDSAFRPIDKDRVKNANQFTWVLVLKANRPVGYLAWLSHILWALLGAMADRELVSNGKTPEKLKAADSFLMKVFGVLAVCISIY
ncbi:hypothetical protein L1887_04247 [Cichorium endivia]|nr:hypothetical protein L1887_04247 [Cichorium endivia]